MWLLSVLLACHVIIEGGATVTQDEIDQFRGRGYDVTDNGASWIFRHSGLPDYTIEPGTNPNTPTAQNYEYEIPKVATNVSDADVGCVYLGPVAMSISGATFFNPYTANGYNAVAGDCKEEFDSCQGHADPSGTYHYHQLPDCLYDQEDLRDVLLGIAFDGYPIYGPMDSTGKDWTSMELDKCHGHWYNGRYVYRITLDFPYIVSCYRGALLFDNSPRGGGGGDGMRPPPDGGRPPPRGKREALEVKLVGHRYMYKRQIIQNTGCREAEMADWMQATCWAVCENPSTQECHNTPPDTTTSRGGGTRKTTPTVRVTTDDDTSDVRKLAASLTVMMCAVVTARGLTLV